MKEDFLPINSSNRPNVIVIFTDQQRWDSTGVHGNPLDLTPNFDQLARTGTHAVHAVTPHPVCGPARAAIQTGQYGTRTGCFRNAVPLPKTSRTLADYFGAAGYKTGYIGKWHLAGQEPVPTGQRGGYQSWLGSDALEFTSDAYRTIMFDDDDEPVSLPGYRSDALFDAAIRFVADHTDPSQSVDITTTGPGGPDEPDKQRAPFFLFCSVIEPHHQNEIDAFPAPTGYAEHYQGRWLPPDLAALASGEGATVHRHIGGYFGQIRRVDEGLGRLLDALRSTGLLENTIIAFTSDHGCHFKTRNAEYKRSCHDASIRVPLAMTGPGLSGGRRIDRPVSTIDLPPTLLDAAGLEVPTAMQGRSLMPLVIDPDGEAAADWPAEAFIQVSETEVGRALRTHRWKYYVTAPDADPWEQASSDHYVETALYDLHHDPYELHNLVGQASHRDVTGHLRQRLIDRMADAGENRPHVEPHGEVPDPLGQRQVDPNVHREAWRPTRFAHQPRLR
ncbi:arylsulfatase [Brachybacterium sp. P6-10-X1]|uniref:sulfatase-like hydrolase/transferase n=1 Tax=Brachybacterium sp. P6-10-X1 TaxID=1903186 RepID=UPI000971802E|nr:sulfatase-like hydrolase/transferase [Brachybacterium sp. P6-10-X1]APX31813.1 arylsulfatase [Brachybacterium sp. P6-10-X1]